MTMYICYEFPYDYRPNILILILLFGLQILLLGRPFFSDLDLIDIGVAYSF